jgi:hypothetical protein
MKSEKFYLNHHFGNVFKLMTLSALLTFWSIGVNAQCSLACNDLVNVSLDEDCIVTITPDIMLEGQGIPANCTYTVQVLNANGTPRTFANGTSNPVVNSGDIGKTLQVRVFLGANSCWGLVKVEDKLAPRVNCRPKREVACWDKNFDPNLPVRAARAKDNCNQDSIIATVVSDVTTEMPCTGRLRARRIVRYQAVDPSGNKSVICSDTIDYVGITLADVKFPKNYDSTLGHRPHLSCDGSWEWGGVYDPATRRYVNQYQELPNGTLAPGSSWDRDGDGYPDPEETGAPFVPNSLNVTGYIRGYMVSGSPVVTATVPGCTANAKVGYNLANGPWRTACDGNLGMNNFRIDTLYSPLSVGNSICKINITYSDTEVPICANSFKILREWKVIEWCTGKILPHYQIIKVVDDRGPIVSIATDNFSNVQPCAPNFDVSSVIPANPYTCTGEWIVEHSLIESIYDCSDSLFIINNYNVMFALRNNDGSIPTDGPFYFTRGEVRSEKLTTGPNRGKWRLSNLPLGCTWIKFTFVDECGNTSNAFTEVQVEDRTPPVAVCDEFTVATLSNNGVARIFAETFDDGSHDNCTNVGFEVARMQAGCGQSREVFGKFIDVCCDDITRQVVDANGDGVIDSKDRGYIQVILRVWDDANDSGIFGDDVIVSPTGVTPVARKRDNFNTCMVLLKVEDKVPPIITCPRDVTIECGADTSSLIHGRPVLSDVILSTPYYTDNCPGSTMSWRNSGTIDNCGQGVITRTFTVYASGYTPQNAALTSASCQQRITVRNTVPYTGPKICPPNGTVWCGLENRTITGCIGSDTDPSKTGVPQLGETACSQVAYTYEDQVFNFVENVCYKILRKWTVIDWCKFAPNLDPQGRVYPSVPTKREDVSANDVWKVNTWTYTQTIKVSDDTNPNVTRNNANKTFDATGPACNGTIELVETATDCSPAATAALKWKYLVDLYDDDIITNTPLATSNNNSIAGNNNDASGVYPVGTHEITWTVEDQCGNQKVETYKFTVRDTKKPTPYCLGSLVTVVMPVQGFTEIWAVDYDRGSTDNCERLPLTNNPCQNTNPCLLYFTFQGMSPVRTKLCEEHFFKGNGQNASPAEYQLGLAQKWIPSTCTSGIYLDCDDVDASPFDELEVWVWDQSWNSDYCTVTIDVQANEGCTGSRVAGNISRTATEMVKNVQVTLTNTNNNETKLALTDQNGKYEFFGMSNGANYLVTPEKDDDPLNGVSTLDLVLMQRHILNINKFDHAHKYLAGDINRDNKITASDLVELRKLILGIYAKLPSNKSWRFVDKNATFADNANPWSASEKINIANFTTTMVSNNFSAIKIGDINSSATVGFNAPVEGRTAKNLELKVDDVEMSAGQDVVINVTTSTLEKMSGAQWTMNFDPAFVEFKNVLAGVLKIDESNYHVSNNKVAFSWNEVKGQTFKKNEILFTLVLKATTNTQLSKVLSITSDAMNSEAYTHDLSTMGVKMTFESRSQEIFTLGQNNPNPFTDKTSIAFTLPQAGQATITIYDLTGKVVRQISNSFPKGQSEIVIKAEDLQATGVLFYELESLGQKSTKKMIYLGK